MFLKTEILFMGQNELLFRPEFLKSSTLTIKVEKNNYEHLLTASYAKLHAKANVIPTVISYHHYESVFKSHFSFSEKHALI